MNRIEMQPAHVEQLDLSKDPDILQRNDDLEDIEPEVYDAVEVIKNKILKLKKVMFHSIVSNDSTHNASDLGAMTNFHSLFLQSIAFWISLLDGKHIPMPELNSEKNREKFDEITNDIEETKSNPDKKVLLYNMLTQLTHQPFSFGDENINSE